MGTKINVRSYWTTIEESKMINENKYEFLFGINFTFLVFTAIAWLGQIFFLDFITLIKLTPFLLIFTTLTNLTYDKLKKAK